MRRLYVAFVVFLVAVALSALPAIRAYKRYSAKVSLLKLIESSKEGEDFLKRNPDFIQSVIDYPIVVDIMINFINFASKPFDFIETHKTFLEEIKLSPRLQKILLFYSGYPLAVELFTRDFKSFHVFLTKHTNLVEQLILNKEFADYVLQEHIDKFKDSIYSADPAMTGKKNHEQFVIDKYLKSSSKVGAK